MEKNKKTDIWKFIKKGRKNECWPYIGNIINARYGRFFYEGNQVGAHRVVYELTKGEIPNGLFVMHKCNNKLCCNPNHLTIGSNKTNQLHAVHSRSWKAGASGITGVGFDKKREYWTAQCYENGKRRNLYTGPHKDKAIAARKRWEKENLVHFNNEGERND